MRKQRNTRVKDSTHFIISKLVMNLTSGNCSFLVGTVPPPPRRARNHHLRDHQGFAHPRKAPCSDARQPGLHLQQRELDPGQP